MVVGKVTEIIIQTPNHLKVLGIDFEIHQHFHCYLVLS